ncbi:MAG: hypothetical protein ACRDMJ_06900 [Solirubrobacteraceae bacterium]
MDLVIASQFLTSSLLSILMPILLLLILTAWYVHQVKRQPGQDPVLLSPEEAERRRAARDAVPAPGVNPGPGGSGGL